MRLTMLVTDSDDGAYASLHLNDEDALVEALERITEGAHYRESYAEALKEGPPETLRDALCVLNDNPGPGFPLGSYTTAEHEHLPVVPLADFLRVVGALRRADTAIEDALAHGDFTRLADAQDAARATLDSVAAFIPLARAEAK